MCGSSPSFHVNVQPHVPGDVQWLYLYRTPVLKLLPLTGPLYRDWTPVWH